MNELEFVNWISSDEAIKLDTAAYWNDVEVEYRKKLFFDIQMLESNEHLNRIYDQLIKIIEVRQLNLENSTVLSLAAGTCWLEARLMQSYPDRFSLTAVDFSLHRIHSMAPEVFRNYGLCSQRVKLVHGSMLNLKVADSSQDVILLSQAFHHTNEPIALLREIRRVIRPDGVALILGEHYYGLATRMLATLKHIIKFGINYKGRYRRIHSIVPDYQTLFPRCYLKGDIHYPMVEYDAMFTGMGFHYQRFVDKHKTLQAFVLTVQ